MVALAICSLALLTMIGVFTSGLRLVHQGERVTASAETARELLEATKELGYAAVPDADVVFDSTRDAPVNGFPPEPYPGANGQPMRVMVQILRPGLKCVAVQVFRDRNASFTLETFLVEPAP